MKSATYPEIYTVEKIRSMLPNDLWEPFMGQQSRREWLACYSDGGAKLDIESTLRVDFEGYDLTRDLDSEAKDMLAAKLAAYLAWLF